MTSNQRALIVFAVLVTWIAGVLVGRATADEPVVVVDVEVVCENLDESNSRGPRREPIVTWWSGTYVVDPFNYDGSHPLVTIAVYDADTGRPIGVLENGGASGLTTHGRHDSWFGPSVPIDGRTITAEVWIDDVLTDSDTAYCALPVSPPVIVDPAPTPPPVVDHPGGTGRETRFASVVRLHAPRPV